MANRVLRQSNVSAVAVLLLAAGGLLAGCAVDERRSARMSAASQPASSSASLTPQQSILYSWREQIRRGAWFRIDQWYARFSSAIPNKAPSSYRKYLKQTSDRDPDLRANGYIGITAASSQAAAGRLDKLIRREKDPNNRTIIVWCLRFIASERAAAALWDFLGSAKDVDYGLCLDTRGQVAEYRAPFPLASAEAFKALYVIKGAGYMLEGPGWAHVLERLGKNIDTEPLRLDWQRLKPDSARRETERETVERMMREFDDK